jgi:type II secretory pathway pseudopilin PulG
MKLPRKFNRQSDAIPAAMNSLSPSGGVKGSVASRRWVRAFSLVEIAISLGVIAVAVIAIMGVLPTGLSVQQDNREDTIINQDANFLLQALANSNTNVTALTNSVDVVRVYTTNITNGILFTNFLAGSNATAAQLIQALSTPRWFPGNTNVTNLVIASIRSFSGTLIEQQATNRIARDFAFAYQLTVDISPAQIFGGPTNYTPPLPTPADVVNSNNYVLFKQREANLYDVKLTFQWPLFPDPTGQTLLGRLGSKVKVFRTLMAGQAVALTNGQTRFYPSTFFLAP